MRFFRGLPFLVICLAGFLPAWSQDPGPSGEGTKEETGEPGSPVFQEVVVVTADRIETALPKVGNTVTVITAEDLARRQHRFVLDALRDLAGIDVRRSGGPGAQTSIFTRGTDSDHTLLLIDGIQVHDPSSPTGRAAINHLLVDDVDRIEVVRGPQSTLYGSDSIGGVINVITKKGAGKPVHSFSGEGGSFGTTSGSFRTSGGSGKVNYSLSATRIDSDNFSAQASDGEDDPYRNTSLAGRFGVEPSDAFRVDFYFRHVDAGLEFDAGSDPANAREITEQTIFKAEPRWFLFDGRWEQKLSLWAHDIDRENRVTGFAFPSDFRGSFLGVDWQNNLYLHRNHTFTLGLEFERQEAEGRVTGFSGFRADTDNLALYVQDHLEWQGGLSASIGFRIDDHAEFGTQVTYRLSGTYDLAEAGTRFLGSVGTGFKAPSLSELFDGSFGSNNPDLGPEESFGFDAGVAQSLRDGRIGLGATFFYNDIDGMIVAVPDARFVFRNVNVERARTRGVETFVEILAGRIWSSRLTYTYTDTEAKQAASFGISEGSRLLRRPLHSLGADLHCRFLPGRGQATLTLLYIGERPDLDPNTFATVTADGYLVANLAGSYRLHGNVELFGRIDNLLDEDYQEVLGFNTPGISAYGGVRIDF